MTLLAVFCFLGARAQTTVEIGDGGTAKNTYLPGYNLYYYSLTQQIYTADEIGMAGTINSIAFKNTGAEKTRTYNVYMLLTDKETFTGGTDWVAMSDGDLVFAGELTFSVGEWTTITLDNPFSYDGVSNLLVGVADNTGSESFSPHMACLVFDATSQAIRAYRDAGAYDIAAPGSGTVMDVKNQILLEITPAGGQICEKPEALTANGEPTDTEFSFTIVGGSGLYNIELKAGSGDWTSYATNFNQTAVNLTGLTGNTAYQVRVQSVCDGGTTSGWKYLNFTTQNPCAKPTNLQITDITTESATLTWTPGYQETTWTVKYKKAADASWDDAIVETVNGTPSLTLSGLSSLTTYNVQVYNCENYVSANFTTAAGIPLNEAFAATSAPTGWTRYNALLSTVMDGGSLGNAVTSGWSFGTGNNVFDSHAKVNIYGTNCKYWLVTPTLLMEDNVQLTFDMALTVWSSSSSNSPTPGNQADDKFVVLITTDGGTTWEILRQWDNAGSEYVYDEITNAATGQAVAIDLSSYANQNIAIAFYGESTVAGGDNNLHIDNVSIDYIPDCAKPTGLAASDMTAHEATITWTSDAAAWQVQLNDGDPIDVEETTYTFTELAPETTYSVKVRANCGGIYSEWTTAVSFTTTIACPAPTNLAVSPDALSATFTWESFADEWEVAYATDANLDPAEFIVGTVTGDATYTVDDLEVGDYYFWVRGNCGDEDGYSQWAGPVKVHIGYCVPNPSSRDGKGITKVEFGIGDDVVINVGETNGLPATSPYYGDYSSMVGAMQAGVESTVSITYATGSSTVYSYGTIIWVDWDNSLSFEDSEIVYTGTSAQGSGGVPQVLDATFTIPATQATGDYRMRIAGADSYFDSYIGGTATANHSACFSNSYSVCHDYTLRVLEAPSCLTPTDLAIDYTGGTEATISWTSDAEAWSLSVNDEVIENVTNPYTLTGLELATTYSVKVQTVCSETDQSEWSNPVSFTTDICMPENQCTISYSFTDQYDDSWNGAYINIVDATTGKVLHELTMPDVEGPYEGSFNVCDGRDIQFVWVSGSYPRECGYTFTDINGEIILEKATNSAAPDAGVFFTYTVDCTPNPCPKPTDLTAGTPGGHSVELSWTSDADAWQICVNGDVTNLINVTENPYTLGNLNSETEYTVKVRTKCGEEEFSSWSSEISFTTDIACAVPTFEIAEATESAIVTITGEAENYNLRYRTPRGFIYDFEKAEPWIVDNFAPCTTYDGDQSQGYNFTGSTYTNIPFTGSTIAFQSQGGNMPSHSGNAFGLMICPADGSQANDWFILPEITIANGDIFSFWGRAITNQYGNETVVVGIYGDTEGTLATEFETIETSATTYTKYEYDLSAYAGQSIRLAINYTSTDIFGFMFDDIFVGNPADDTWDYTLDNVTSPYEITGLTPETDYEVQVQSVCGDGGVSDWSTIVSFTTLPLCPVPTNLAADEITAHSAVMTWESAAAATSFDIEVNGVVTEGVTSPYALENLAAGTLYSVRVRAYYGSTLGYSDWTTVYSFYTDCDAKELPYEYGFETGDDLACWSSYQANTANLFGILNAPNNELDASDGDYVFLFSSYSQADAYDQILISPELNTTAAVAVEFYYRSYGNYGSEDGETFKVGYSTTTNDPSEFIWGDEISTNSADWVKFQEAFPAGTKYVAVWYCSTYLYYFLVDGFKFYEIPTLELANDATDISTIIADNAGKYANVTLTGRTLFKDGKWNTICLPFDVTIAGSPLDGEGVTAKTLVGATVTSNHVSLDFGNANLTELEAGKPYIIKWKEMTKGTGDIVDPVFENVLIKNTLVPNEDNSDVHFIGYYDALVLDPVNGTSLIPAADVDNIYYMTAQNTLKYTDQLRTLKSLRAYFWFSDALVNSSPTRSFTLNFGDGESSGIISIDSEQLESNWYTIDGKMLDKQPTRKGVYIKDGVKVVIK